MLLFPRCPRSGPTPQNSTRAVADRCVNGCHRTYFQQYTQGTAWNQTGDVVGTLCWATLLLLSWSLLSLGQSAGAIDREFSLNTMPHIWKEYKAAKLWDMFPREIRMLWKCVGSFPGSPNCCVLNRRQRGPQPCALPGPSSRFGGLGWGPVLLWPCPGAQWLALPVNWCLFCQIQWRCAW